MKRQADRQDNIQIKRLVFLSEPRKERNKVLVREIKILEEREKPDIGDEADDEIKQFKPSPDLLYGECCNVIDDDDEKKDQDVFWHKDHVKITADHKDPDPSELMWQKIIHAYSHRQEKKEM
jgi:hypothetical protein